MNPLDFATFARWALPLRSNATRGLFGEYLIACAVDGDLTEPRDEWGNHDVITRSGTTIEVKTTALLQAWGASKTGTLTYSGLRARWLNDDGVTYSGTPDYRSAVYVFALHTATTPADYDLFALDQWEFRVLPRARLVDLGQDSISLTRLASVQPHAVGYHDLAEAVADAASAPAFCP